MFVLVSLQKIVPNKHEFCTIWIGIYCFFTDIFRLQPKHICWFIKDISLIGHSPPEMVRCQSLVMNIKSPESSMNDVTYDLLYGFVNWLLQKTYKRDKKIIMSFHLMQPIFPRKKHNGSTTAIIREKKVICKMENALLQMDWLKSTHKTSVSPTFFHGIFFL
jgi:hypothetical protein